MTEWPQASGAAQPEIDSSVPHSARVWNYWLGGKDNYEPDRMVGDHYRGTAYGSGSFGRVRRRHE